MPLAMTFNEIGQRALFSSECRNTVYLYSMTDRAFVNEIRYRFRRMNWGYLAISPAANAPGTVVSRSLRRLRHRRGFGFLRNYFMQGEVFPAGGFLRLMLEQLQLLGLGGKCFVGFEILAEILFRCLRFCFHGGFGFTAILCSAGCSPAG